MHFMHPRRAQPARTIFVYLTLGLLTFVLGCQSTPEPNAAGEQALLRIQQGPTAERNEFGLHRVDLEEGQGILFVKGPRPHLEQFDGLLLEPVVLEPSNGGLPWKSSTTKRLGKSFSRTLKKSLKRQETWSMGRRSERSEDACLCQRADISPRTAPRECFAQFERTRTEQDNPRDGTLQFQYRRDTRPVHSAA